jgi:hypothetical protein
MQHEQLLLFDSSFVSSAITYEGSNPPDISPEFEGILWLIVDYGLMCSRSAGQPISPKIFREPTTYEDAECFPDIDFSLNVDTTDGLGTFCTDFEGSIEPMLSLTNIECGM